MSEKQTTSAPAAAPAHPETIRPTKRQRLLLEFIDDFIQQHGYSPSYREIMNGLSYTSVSTVALHVSNLIKRGHIRMRDYSARSLEIVNPELIDKPKIKTNIVKPGEEKWLIEKVDYVFSSAENEATMTEEVAQSLVTLISALELLGLDSGATQFKQRLSKLTSKSDGQ